MLDENRNESRVGERKQGPAPPMHPEEVLERVLGVAEGLNYTGYSKHDALNARWLESLAGGSRLMRIAFIQIIMRFPLHIRPLVGVCAARNAKGLSLFSRAYLSRFRRLGDKRDLQKAELLLQWLLNHTADGFEGPSWGYPYPWQDVGFFVPRNHPNRVVTCFVLNAFLDAFEVTNNSTYFRMVSI